ncbi:transposase [Streptomyces dysideae]|uniref:transposase n=1 Tax=Streptomyces dysideae TaxID=909626 RepID=UPI000A62A622
MQQSSVPTAGQSSSVTWECDCLAHRFGNAADNGLRQPRYPTDMTDVEWAAVRPLLPVPGWMRGRDGRPEAYCHRAVLDAIRYLVDNGIKWRAMPADFPPWDRVYAFFRRWRDHGLVKEFHDRLRAQVREKAGRDAEPTAAVIDSQSVKADRPVSHDATLYKDRNTVERAINKFKESRGLATRYDKTPESYAVGLHLRGSILWLRSLPALP